MADENGADDLFRLYGLLALAKGLDTTAEDVHNAWVGWMVRRGEDRRSLRPFVELRAETQDKTARLSRLFTPHAAKDCLAPGVATPGGLRSTPAKRRGSSLREVSRG